MSAKSATQRENLVRLADTLFEMTNPTRYRPQAALLGRSRHHRIHESHVKATEFYGLSMREIIDAVKENNRTPAAIRNEHDRPDAQVRGKLDRCFSPGGLLTTASAHGNQITSSSVASSPVTGGSLVMSRADGQHC